MKDLYEIQSPLEVERPIPWIGKNYTFLSTKEVVNQMTDLGWKMVQLQFNNPFSTHEVHFEKGIFDTEDDWRGLGVQPQVVFTNSFDGKSAAMSYIGILRQVCSNGLIAWTRSNHSRSRHARSVKDWSKSIVQMYDTENQSIQRLIWKAQTTKPSDSFLRKLKMSVVKLRNIELRKLSSAWEEILRPIRWEDEEPTLWNVYNIAQEKAIRGFGNYTEIKDTRRRLMINVELWKLVLGELDPRR